MLVLKWQNFALSYHSQSMETKYDTSFWRDHKTSLYSQWRPFILGRTDSLLRVRAVYSHRVSMALIWMFEAGEANGDTMSAIERHHLRNIQNLQWSAIFCIAPNGIALVVHRHFSFEEGAFPSEDLCALDSSVMASHAEYGGWVGDFARHRIDRDSQSTALFWYCFLVLMCSNGKVLCIQCMMLDKAEDCCVSNWWGIYTLGNSCSAAFVYHLNQNHQ